ncbi:hypothetical protein EUTSA_v10015134mg [Eutrema salsugineum]|uniref:Defensin-like domain-containing protein n=1 Tax=Eutrema salsugineum TaxID=72664 RepID=V4KYL8_EUTSA|nr:hypothetical protein EUTSA_v10015134mg [Eutrema salsugineum]
MDFSKLMVVFTLVILIAVSSVHCQTNDLISAETGMKVQDLPPNCGKDTQECNESFLDQDCNRYCVQLSYKHGVCILSEGLIGPNPPKYSCCCD